ncbi:WbqC family protein [Cuspidothrix issatschenkoi]|nr:WbqC family protein [Cuspidothrix issatschenkoi]
MKKTKIVAIHQPNFFPWLGYFDKIARSDIFIIMDNVQFPKTGAGTWSNRAKLLIAGQSNWITMPIIRSYSGKITYQDIQINNHQTWRSKLLKTIQINYCRSSFFDIVFPQLLELINYPTDSLVDFNLNAIHELINVLELDISKFILGSNLKVEGNATDLLISMVKAVEGTAYLCGGGASGYQENDKFSLEGIELIYQNFQHPVYQQINTKEFVSGLSIIDVLMNCGFEKTRELLYYHT